MVLHVRRFNVQLKGILMEDFEIRPLKNSDFHLLHGCWLIAYGDYKVPTQLSKRDLEIYMLQNGVNFEASAGVFVNNKMAGFIINGVRKYDDVLTAYDAGTAIVPEYRGKGLSTRLFTEIERALKPMGIKKYLLEVICNNEPAYKAYQKNGFKIVRALDCFETNIAPVHTPKYNELNIFKTNFEKCLPLIPRMIEYKPSWHNSTESIKAIKNTICTFFAELDKKVVGYALISHKSRGRLLQIGVLPELRTNGIYEALISRGCSEFDSGQKIRMINLPDEAMQTKLALKNSGFTIEVSQYEMEKLY